MKIRGRLTPYPLLAKTNDNYRTASFDGIAELKEEAGKLRLAFRAVLRCPALKKLLQAGLAGYALHLESPITSYRRLFELNDESFRLELSADEVCGVLQVTPFIVAKTEIRDYTSDDFHEVYEGMAFSFERGHILALDETTEFILAAPEEAHTLPSILRLEPLEREAGHAALRVDCGSDYIIARLPRGLYDIYRRYAKSTYAATFLAGTILPALVAALSLLREDLRTGAELSKRWERVLLEILEQQQIAIADDGADVLEIAQKLFQDPVSRSFQELEDLAEQEAGQWK